MAKRGQSRLAKPLIIIAVIAGLAYGGPRTYFSYRADQALSRIQQASANFADISYDSVWVDFMGETATIYDLTIRIQALDDAISMEEVRLHVGGFNGLGQLHGGDRIDSIPESMRVAVEGVEIDVDGAIYDTVTSQASHSDQQKGTLARLMALGCDNPADLDEAIVEHLGVGRLIMSMRLGFDYNEADSVLVPSISVDIEQLQRIEANLRIEGIGPEPGRLMQLGGLRALQRGEGPRLSSARFRIVDQGYNNARNRVCADRTESQVSEFIDRHVETLGALMERTGTRSPDALERYRDYVRHGGDIVARLEPNEALTIQELSRITKNIAIFRLNPTIEINGEAINPTVARWFTDLAATPADEVAWSDEQTSERSASAKGDSGDGDTDSGAAGESSADNEETSRNRPVPVSELGSYVDYRVQITMQDGKSYLGRLTSVDDGQVEIRIQQSGGYVGYNLKQNQIREARVRR
jgi:hypothetical protein